ncbi:MAG: hypothetical protein KW793_00800 [Candidatus Doudnabacteria bacterium]|nr:hypothetical protein [Candidatus Doudnabacteria bacterium]
MVYFFILLGAVLRVLPHPGNFAPIAAMALFGGTYLSKKQALIVPVAAMVMSDLFIGFDSWTTRGIVYGSFMATALIGIWLKNHKNVYTIACASLASSVIFYLVTNLPFVHPASLYPYTLDGTMTSYINALSFFKNTVIGDLFYTTVFFGAFELVKMYVGSKRQIVTELK